MNLANTVILLLSLAHFSECSLTSSLGWKILAPKNGTWQEWQPWGLCSERNGSQRIRKRRRTCSEARWKGEQLCDIGLIETQEEDCAYCPIKHIHPFADGKQCCQLSRQSENAGCDSGAVLMNSSPEQCCGGEAVPCTAPFCETEAVGTLSLDCSNSGLKGPGLYSIKYDPDDDSKEAQAICTFDGWTIIQSRGQFGNPIDYFYRDWQSYKEGFGIPGKEHWIGLDAISNITNTKNYKLRVDMAKSDGETAYAEYSSFKISDEEDGYRLSVSGYQGTAGDSLQGRHNGDRFSTKDMDLDKHGGSCAEIYQGAWWYDKCYSSSLNGPNRVGDHDLYGLSISWNSFNGYYNGLANVSMAIKPN